MKYIVTGKQAKEIDRIAIQEIGIPSVVLMERAALKLAEHIRKKYSKEERILFVCGMGNNGADGVCAGRILAQWGYQVSIFLLGETQKATEEMKQQLTIAHNLSLSFEKNPQIERYTIIVDGIFGVGLCREIKGEYRAWIEKINAWKGTVIAIDSPSGVDTDSGQILGIATRAKETVTFGYNKIGMVLYPGRAYAGTVYVEDIGFPKEALERIGEIAYTYEFNDCMERFPKRIAHSNKGTYGKVLVIAGSKEISGAAYFAAAGAYRTGCGLVKVITHEKNRTMLQQKLPEALSSVYSSSEDCLTAKERLSVAEAIQWATVIVIGPGLGTDSIGRQLLCEVLKEKEKPVVIDADGINLLAQMEEYFDNQNKICLGKNVVLTPHVKEMSRLVKKSVSEIQENIFEVSKMTNGATIVLKDAPTVVSDGKRQYINSSGNSALAKGGSGDVLSGIIGGLFGLGCHEFLAATLGVYLHGLTADEYVKSNSSSSMIAEDMIQLLPKVLP